MPGKILLLGAVRGLVSEGQRVANAIVTAKPDIVAVAVSKEGLEAMRNSNKFTPDQIAAANPEEEAYMEGLAEFGEVKKPPPCFSVAQEKALAVKIPVEPLDMDDEHYTAAYCKYVTTLDMMRQSGSRKSILRHAFTSETPEDFVMEWDGLVNRLKGYRELEDAREMWMAKGISRLAEGHKLVLAIVELERLDGIEGGLREMGREPERVH